MNSPTQNSCASSSDRCLAVLRCARLILRAGARFAEDDKVRGKKARARTC